MAEELKPRYNHNENEEEIYELWEKSGFFNPDNLPGAKSLKPFTIIMPPTNANGSLHIGHAVGFTVQDILTRFWRMRGRRALWLPGDDHAGFETLVVFEKKLKKEGRDYRSENRDKIWKEIWDFTQENRKNVIAQTKKLGASCDWSRRRFTLDEKAIKIVHQTFKKLYDDGLAYRDLRIINWCPKHRTALSDLEINYVERKDSLYYIKYGPLTLATVRPETKFGDTALAVNPNDQRYKKFIGQEIESKGLLGPVRFKVIADKAVDPEFGTGVVKVTPAHDQNDFEIWQRHKEEIEGPKVIIDESGRLTGPVGKFKGLKVNEAREATVEEMKKIGILEKVDDSYVHQVATCYKCGSTIEPIPKPQWFLKMKPLAGPAIKAVKSGRVKIIPKNQEKTYGHWLENIRDWNISRQIVWGIRIPAWYCKNNCPPVVSEKPPDKCPVCKGVELIQDPDVFDTWFSSGQWPVVALSIDENDFKIFYPTDVLDTAYEILFFWVARMVMLGIYLTGKPPFKTVYLHGLVRDKDKKKMSKSKGNVIDPLGVTEMYGTDSVRMALIAGNTAGSDIVISEEKIKGYRNFVTKIWNISRFIFMNKPEKLGVKNKMSAEDKKDLAEIKKVKSAVTKHLEKLELHLASEKIYHYIWHTLADKVIEKSKSRLKSDNQEEQTAAYLKLEMLLRESLIMLHPIMPFITEAIYQKLNPGKLLMIESWE